MSVLLQILAARLAPLFQTGGSPQDACTLAAQAIAAHDPQSPADYFRIARLIALSIAAISAASQAESPDLSPAQKLRCFHAANSLSRSAARMEAVRAESRAKPDVQQTAAADPMQVDAIDAMIDQAMDEFRSQSLKPSRLVTRIAGQRPVAMAPRTAASYAR